MKSLFLPLSCLLVYEPSFCIVLEDPAKSQCLLTMPQMPLVSIGLSQKSQSLSLLSIVGCTTHQTLARYMKVISEDKLYMSDGA